MRDAPAWFAAALGAPAEEGSIAVGGTTVRYRAWGERGAPGAVLVHGIAAHARWWDHMAPALADGRRIVALDLSGHGDSDHRDSYDLDRWADELLAVADAGGFGSPPHVVGHSIGGLIAMRAAMRAADAFGGLAVIDTVVRTPSPDDLERRNRRAQRRPYVYASRQEALEAFHPIPDEPNALPYVLRHVAESSVARSPDGWSWKFDVRVFGRVALGPHDLAPVAIPVTVIRCERGLMSADMAEEVSRLLGGDRPAVTLPGAGHHAMLDRPLALGALLGDVIGAHPNHDRTFDTARSTP